MPTAVGFKDDVTFQPSIVLSTSSDTGKGAEGAQTVTKHSPRKEKPSAAKAPVVQKYWSPKTRAGTAPASSYTQPIVMTNFEHASVAATPAITTPAVASARLGSFRAFGHTLAPRLRFQPCNIMFDRFGLDIIAEAGLQCRHARWPRPCVHSGYSG